MSIILRPFVGRSDDEVAKVIARRIPPRSFVNLGIGKPLLVSNNLSQDSEIHLHTENGMIGLGPRVESDDGDPDIINAAKQCVREMPGSAYFDSVTSFEIIRGGHLDLCILGAYQVSLDGAIANWRLPESKSIPGVGGSMDLVSGAKQIWIFMSAFSSDGSPKIVKELSLPPTGLRVASLLFTEIGIIRFFSGGARVEESFLPRDYDSVFSELGVSF